MSRFDHKTHGFSHILRRSEADALTVSRRKDESGNENKHNQTRCKGSNQKRILRCKFPLFESFRIRGIEVSLMSVSFNILKETTISIGRLSLYFNKLLRVCQ